ncbi:tape-measure protein [Streptomyces coeruleoprunus]|uniref:Tape-measure protein n=1 Tax=Streptomyces coeruleoprunus TaxID=285563 RepID=A0ABV9XMT8_9ACTN
MSAAAMAAPDPLAGVAGALASFRTQTRAAVQAVRSAVRGIGTAGGAVGRIKGGADAATSEVRQFRTRADGSSRSLAKAGTTAGRASVQVSGSRGRLRGAGSAAAALAGGAAGLISVSELLAAAGVTVTPLMAVLGGALTVAAGAMTAINVAMRANPLGFLVGLIVPVAAYLIELALSSETGQRIMSQVFQHVLKVFRTIWTFVGPVVRAYGTVVATYFKAVLAIVTGVVKGIGAAVDGIGRVSGAVSGATRAVTGIIRGAWDGLRNGVKPVLDWITGKIPEAFTRVKEATANTLRGIGDFIETGLQAIVGVMKAPLQGLIAFANWVIDGLNSLSFSILGKKFGVNIPKIPMLAEGGVVTPPHGSRPGAVLPLSSMDALRPAERSHRDTARREPRRVTLRAFHEPAGSSPYAIAEDLLFLARAA